MRSIHVSTPERHDHLWPFNAFTVVLLTLLGASSEALGYDRYIKSNTIKRCTHSLFGQGGRLYGLIPIMPQPRLQPLSSSGLPRCWKNCWSLLILSGSSENTGSHVVGHSNLCPLGFRIPIW
jgi:hypothetical protein